MHEAKKLGNDAFAFLIRNAPLVSIDIICRDAQDGILLMRRKVEPANGCYFVPGGRILKNEKLASAFERILYSETGLTRKFDEAHLIGVFEHMYDSNRFEQQDYGTHCVVLVYEIALGSQPQIIVDEHHSSYQLIETKQLLKTVDVHRHVKAYFKHKGA